MPTVSMKIDGLAEIMRTVEGINLAVKGVLGEAVKDGADIIRDDAQSRARKRTGEMSRGIRSRVTWNKNVSKAFAVVDMDPAKNDVFVKYTKNGKRYYYPAIIEYKYYPFMRPAMDKNKSRVKQVVFDKVLAAIARASK